MRKVKVIYDHWYPKTFGIAGITLYPRILLAAPKGKVPLRILRHEMIHVEQARRMGPFLFYTCYVLQLLKHLTRRLKTKRKLKDGLSQCFWRAYSDLSYEKEARRRETEPFTGAELAELGLAVGANSAIS